MALPKTTGGSAQRAQALVTMNYREIITIEAGRMGGKPCIRGMRITVYDVLDYLGSGMSEEEILCDFPDLTSADVRACLAWKECHRIRLPLE